MSLATHEEYQSVAAKLRITGTPFIDGKYCAGNGAVIPTLNPATGETLAELRTNTVEEVDFAIGKAREAFNDGRFSRMHPAERKECLIRLAKLIKRRAEEFAVLESLDSGKPIADCVGIDLPEVINTLIWHAELIDKIYDQTAPVGDEALAIVSREAVGVVGLVLPWNFPLLMLAWKIGPALAAGNSVVIKPAEQTSLTALRLAELVMEAGIPEGVFHVVIGDGPTVGAPIGLHPEVDMVSFTGSTETGKRFLRYSAESNLKKVALECGGKNPAVVFADAEELESVASHVVNAAFWNMGENCTANSRLIVAKELKDDLMERVLRLTSEIRVGDPLNPVNTQGCLVDQEHYAKVDTAIKKASNEASLLCGGSGDGRFMPPTIFACDDAKASLMREEIFGPVLAVYEVASAEEAVSVANDTCYGLAASIYSGNGKRALRAARDIRAGTVSVNCYSEGDITTPFGGFKQSGFWGRDNGIHAHDQYTQIKTIWYDLSERTQDEF